MDDFNSDSDEADFQMDDASSDRKPGTMINGQDEDSKGGWINWFCALEGHEYMIEVDISFIRDPFNLYGLQSTMTSLTVEKFRQCIKMIVSNKHPNEDDLADEAFMELNSEASDIYGLIHARYINTATGMAKVYQKYL